jgi:hypothetical protein
MAPDSTILRSSARRPWQGAILRIAACAAVAALVAVPAARASTPAHKASSAPPTHTAAALGKPRFINYVTPNGVGDSAGEPSIGSNWTTEQVFSNSNGSIPNGGTVNYFGGFLPYMVKATFDDCQSPALVTWEQKPLLTANSTRVYGDPILFTDHTTGRTFVSQLEGLTPAGSTTDITDNDGNSFMPSQGGSQPSCVDHQTFGGGPFHAPLTGTTVYPNAIYYASQCVADAVCAVSLDGGLTFGASSPMYTISDCAGLHGHVKVGPDGTVYVPNKSCGGSLPYHQGGNASVAVSENNGVTWTLRTVPDGASMDEWDPSIGVATDGTIYLGYQAANGHAMVAVSHDKGASWATSVDVGVPTGSVQVDGQPILNMVFPEMVAGDPDRAAFAFYGSTLGDNLPAVDHSGGSNNDPNLFPADWYLYIATTYDGGHTWTTQNVTPGDPIQRGPICGGGNCRNMLDFFDETIDKEGRVLVGWDDGCVGPCVNAGPNSNSAKATITRQSGGPRMFAAFDPIEPRVPEAPGLAGNDVDGTVNLTWQTPDNGGSTVTAYNVYRQVGSGSFLPLATVTSPHLTDTVDPHAQVTYRVTAVNALGEGPHCTDYTPPAGPVASSCVLPGLIAVDDVNPDIDSGQNTPPDSSVDIHQLFVAEPYSGVGVSQLVFTLQVGPSLASLPPASSQWYIVYNRKAIAADGSDRRFVEMATDATGNPSFRYGNFGPPLPIGSVPPPNANTPTPLGAADSGSYNAATGLIRIYLSASKADDGGLAAGDHLPSINVRTYYARPDTGIKSQNTAADYSGNGDYTLVGNASCFCTAAHAPIAGLAANPTSGNAHLIVHFDASSSRDLDTADGDAVGSYTFNFGDGTSPVTQASPTITHTYATSNGTAPYVATCTVTDLLCGKASANVASLEIQVDGSTTAVPADKTPHAFKIAPVTNPSRGGTAFTLDLLHDGNVNVELFSADGRRVKRVVDAWMPAGTHQLSWAATDDTGRPVPPGLYLVRARTSQGSALSRVTVLP